MYSVRALAVSVLPLLAGAALAQPETQLRYEVRRYDASNNTGWTASLDAFPGERLEVRALVSYVGTQPVVALGQITFQPTVSNWAAGDTLLTNALLGLSGPFDLPNGVGSSGSYITTPPALTPDAPGVYGRLAPFTAAQVNGGSPFGLSYYQGHNHLVDGTSYLRIARADITNWFGVGATSGPAAINNVTGAGGVTCWQGSLGVNRAADAPPPVLGTQDILVFKFGFTLSGDLNNRDMQVTTPSNGFGTFTGNPGYGGPGIGWFMATNENGVGSRLTTGVSVPAIIHVTVPAPSVVALAGLLLVMPRRRR